MVIKLHPNMSESRDRYARPRIASRVFEGLVRELHDSITAYWGDRDPRKFLETVHAITDDLETFSPGGEASQILNRAQLVIAAKLSDSHINEKGDSDVPA